MVKNGALRVLRVGGLDVYIHWTWLLIVYVLYNLWGKTFTNINWVFPLVALYVGMVLVHELTQLFVGRMVKGSVTELNISFLSRSSDLQLPQRPWPIILTYGSGILAYAFMSMATIAFYRITGGPTWTGDVHRLAFMLVVFSVLLLIWTAAPVYPLEGGRVLYGFLWMIFGQKRGLQIACFVGVPVALGLVAVAFYFGSFLWIISAVLILLQCFQGFRQAKLIDLVSKMPRRTDVSCPHCKQHPFTMTGIRCACGKAPDPFATRGLCHACGSTIALMACPICTQRSPIAAWFGPIGMFEVQGVGAGAAVSPGGSVESGPAALPVAVNEEGATGGRGSSGG